MQVGLRRGLMIIAGALGGLAVYGFRYSSLSDRVGGEFDFLNCPRVGPSRESLLEWLGRNLYPYPDKVHFGCWNPRFHESVDDG